LLSICIISSLFLLLLASAFSLSFKTTIPSLYFKFTACSVSKLAFSVSIKAPKGAQVSFEKTRTFIR
jgi:hypothetical protein